MPNPTKRASEVVILRYPSCQLAMVHGMTDLLQTASKCSAARGGPTLRISHVEQSASGAIAGPRQPSVVIVPGRMAGPLEEAAPFARWLAKQHAAGATLASACAGAFLIAETGLLKGRPATTHWLYADAFRARFPDVELDADKIVIDDGDIVTAAGVMAWTDLGVRLIDRLLGRRVMVETAGYFLIDVGGRDQRHHSGFTPRLDHGDDAILEVQHWLARKVRSVAEMAKHARMEERTFLRRFKAATGMPPREYAQRLRLERARELLRTTRQPVRQIAWSVGYGDSPSFGRLFSRMVGLSPGEYRRRFRVA